MRNLAAIVKAGLSNNFRIADHTIQLSFLCLG
jgi:hypothetical protein